MYGGLIAETTPTGQTQREYIWNGMEPVAQLESSGVTYLHSDHLYTPRLGTDILQAAVWQWESDAFGNSDPQLASVVVNLRFPGQYFDLESGLFYNWNRFYDSGLGRYVTSDPIGLDGGLNTYAYGFLDPISSYDPDGLESVREREKRRGQNRLNRARERDALKRQQEGAAQSSASQSSKLNQQRGGRAGELVFDSLCLINLSRGGSLSRALAKKRSFLNEVLDCSKPCWQISRDYRRYGGATCPGPWTFLAGSCASNGPGLGNTVGNPFTRTEIHSWGRVDNIVGQCCNGK